MCSIYGTRYSKLFTGSDTLAMFRYSLPVLTAHHIVGFLECSPPILLCTGCQLSQPTLALYSSLFLQQHTGSLTTVLCSPYVSQPPVFVLLGSLVYHVVW